MSSTGQRYAQTRRNNERAAGDRLQTNKIPQNFMGNVLEVEPKDTRSAKLHKAAYDVIEDRDNTIADLTNTIAALTNTAQAPAQVCVLAVSPIRIFQANIVSKTTQATPFGPITPTTPPKLKNNEEYQRLKQAWERVKGNIQGRAAEGEELSDEVKQMMDDAHDMMVDVVHKFEGDRTEDA